MGKPIILLFDSECVLCNGSVRFILKRDRCAVFRFAGLNSETGRMLLESYGVKPGSIEAIVMLKEGKLYKESGAALRTFGRLPGLWRLAPLFLVIPRPLRDAIYRWIARNRYRWFGKTESCLLPLSEWKERFLEI